MASAVDAQPPASARWARHTDVEVGSRAAELGRDGERQVAALLEPGDVLRGEPTLTVSRGRVVGELGRELLGQGNGIQGQNPRPVDAPRLGSALARRGANGRPGDRFRRTVECAERSPPRSAGELLTAPLYELMAEAARLRDEGHGHRVTFSPKVFIPLTMLCRDRCGYCTFAKPPARLEHPYLSLDDVLAIARAGAALGCHEALFTLGEAPEDRYPAAARVARRARLQLDGRLRRRRGTAPCSTETGLLPHANAGALTRPTSPGCGPSARRRG